MENQATSSSSRNTKPNNHSEVTNRSKDRILRNYLEIQDNREQEILKQEISELEKTLHRITNSRSWKLTCFLRRGEAMLRNFLKIRQQELHEEGLQDTNETDLPEADTQTHMVSGTQEVAVIIICYNYGHYLPEAIESVLAQTYKPTEIIVVDDNSSDNTKEVAESYNDKGIRYIRDKYDHPSIARNEGAKNTSSAFIMFLDADDILEKDYIQKCISHMKDTSVAIVYGDMHFFGKQNALKIKHEFDRNELFKENYISSHALIRRQAFDVAGGYRNLKGALEDWDLYRRILNYPWIAKKADTKIFYRTHNSNRSKRIHVKSCGLWERAGLLHNPITIFTPFAGRKETFEKYLEGLKNLNFNQDFIRLHWFDTSGDKEFGQMLKNAMATLPFGRTTYTSAPLPSYWNHTPENLIKNRVTGTEKDRYYYDLALVYAYNNLITTCDTEFALTLEDDIVLTPNSLTKLIKTINKDTIVAVLASYPCQLQGYQLVWVNDKNDKPRLIQERLQHKITKIDGGGFGCSLFRMSALRKMPIYTRVYENPSVWYDHTTFANLRAQGEVLCNWEVEVEHLETERFV
ncbi:glycosyltransferase [Patescibacteria group bacterium]|nr:glycosyltransferase [Patescibacteria group bacterium]MBU1123413.1 glycosyltransferase [Patescibacteria group bacterium]MBU1911380.1 glycosyltransferase [Patescibacteria group bacterium]